jgi:hypothetical protein
VVPDLEFAVRSYINALAAGNSNASIKFMESTFLGIESRPKGLRNIWHFLWGSSRHLWMWDKASLLMELKNAGFVNIRQCEFNDSADKMFEYVEDAERFANAIAFECSK